MNFPKTDDQLVIDTHVLRAAIEQEQKGIDGAERQIILRLAAICSRIRLSRKQVGRKEERGELIAQLRAADPRMPFLNWKLIRNLDARDKLLRTDASKLSELPREANELLNTGGGRDDHHLYQTALLTSLRSVITRDVNLLSLSRSIEELTEVATVSVEDTLQLLTVSRE